VFTPPADDWHTALPAQLIEGCQLSQHMDESPDVRDGVTMTMTMKMKMDNDDDDDDMMTCEYLHSPPATSCSSSAFRASSLDTSRACRRHT
jgi:hypothetical protein